MGPCWLQIEKPHVEYDGVCFSEAESGALAQALRRSWVQVRGDCRGPKRHQSFCGDRSKRPRDTPSLTTASLSIRTIVNHHENIREIVCATARIWSNGKWSMRLTVCQRRAETSTILQFKSMMRHPRRPYRVRYIQLSDH